jgi:hypothetical protein
MEVYEFARGKAMAPTRLAHILPESSNAGVPDRGSDFVVSYLLFCLIILVSGAISVTAWTIM